MRRPGRYAAAPLVLLTAIGLSACGEVSPGAAATVDGEVIPLDEVDEAARALCVFEQVSAEQRGEQPQSLGTGDYRLQVLTVLVNAEVTEQVGSELGVEVPPASYAGGLGEEFDPIFAAMPDDEEAVLVDFAVTAERWQATLRAIGAQTAGSADAAAGEQAVLQADPDVELDPRFGRYVDGQIQGGSGSLSVPAGSGAEAADPPASQTCG